ncbi:MAG: glycosyltransferase family 39 protein [Gemmatimonadaceae bacterium]|nr:glycosyltransferase family 39 protein [Gemmatimonadaceae bacterium]
MTDEGKQGRTEADLPARPFNSMAPGLAKGLALLTLCFVIVGSLLRLARLVGSRPLWEDEAFLALNFLTRSSAELLKPLDSVQLSPLAFVAAEWSIVQLGGRSEVALRWLPCVAGVLALVLLHRVCRRVLDPLGALFATAFAAFSPLLLDYSVELKSYSFDLLATAAMMQVTLDVAEQRGERRTLAVWAIVAFVVALISTAAPLIVAGAGATGMVALWRYRARSAAGHLLLAGFPAAIAFLFQFLTIYSSPSTLQGMQSYWQGNFIEFGLPETLLGLARTLRELWLNLLFGSAAETWLPRRSLSAALVVSGIGAWTLVQQRSLVLTLLVAPFLLAVLASMLHRWPMQPRLLLFAAPMIVMSFGAGLSRLIQCAPLSLRLSAMLVISIVTLGGAVRGAVESIQAPAHRVELPSAMEYIGKQPHSVPVAYVSAHFLAACRYYTAWHPRREQLVGQTVGTECQLRGTRVLYGRWPEADQSATRIDGTVVSSPNAWIEEEAERILAVSEREVWLVLPEDGPALLSRLGARGAVQRSAWRASGVLVLRFSVPPRSPRSAGAAAANAVKSRTDPA